MSDGLRVSVSGRQHRRTLDPFGKVQGTSEKGQQEEVTQRKHESIPLREYLTDKIYKVPKSLYETKLDDNQRRGIHFLFDERGNMTYWTANQVKRKPLYTELEEQLEEKDAEIERLKARLRRMA